MTDGIYYILNPDNTYRQGTLEEWGNQLKTEGRHLGDTTVGEYRISTVWLGMNHNWSEIGAPLLFETMVFDRNNHDVFMERYTTAGEAQAGHERTVQWVKEGLPDL